MAASRNHQAIARKNVSDGFPAQHVAWFQVRKPHGRIQADFNKYGCARFPAGISSPGKECGRKAPGQYQDAVKGVNPKAFHIRKTPCME